MQAAQKRLQSNAARARDLSIGLLLFCATATFTLWQNLRVAVLWDLSYLLETSWRISLGQLPYRDFPLAHAPGTFLLHAAIIRIFGRVYWPHIACAALEAGAATLFSWRILLRLLQAFGASGRWTAFLLAATLVPLGIYSIYPHPIYDSDCVFTLLIALYLLVRAAESWESEMALPSNGGVRSLTVGATCVIPLIFKQNIGLAFLAAVVIAIGAAALVRRSRHQRIGQPAWFLAGIVCAAGAGLLAIQLFFGIANYRHWTINFAAQQRLPGAATMLGVYHQASLLWSIPAAVAGLLLLGAPKLCLSASARAAAFLLLAAPFLWPLAALASTSDPDDRADQLLSLWPHVLVLAGIFASIQIVRFTRRRAASLGMILPTVLLAAIHGTFLSQQLWGSTYAIWPMFLLLVATMLPEVRRLADRLVIAVTVTLLVCGTLYAVSLERLDYIHRDGLPARATVPELRGLSTPGPWIPDFENLVRFTDAEIPPGDSVLAVPGEDPFYFTTGRVPQFPVLLFDRTTTDPYTPQQARALVRARNVRWLIVQRDLQIDLPPAFGVAETEAALLPEFGLYRQLPGYDVYRRK